jgi:hypothetical protein
MSEWQPISTVSEIFGHDILGWVPSYYGGKGGCSVIYWAYGWTNGEIYVEPSHWQPLPDGPKSEAAAQS